MAGKFRKRCIVVLTIISLQLLFAEAQFRCIWNSPAYNTHYSGGVLQQGVTTVGNCKIACEAQQPSCVGVDYDYNNANQNYCYLTLTSSAYSSASSGVDHYSIVSGSCSAVVTNAPNGPITTPSCTWNATSNAHTTGGTNQPSITTLSDCQAQCSGAGSNCQGIDWDPNTPGKMCWFSVDNNLQNAPGITHYQLLCLQPQAPVPTGACSWTPTLKTHSIGGILFSSYTTLTSCEDACRNYNGGNVCLGVDWPRDGSSQCWFSIQDATQPYETTDHYTYKCNGVSKVFMSAVLMISSTIFATFLMNLLNG